LPDADPRVRHSDPLMWVDALDLAFERIVAQGLDLGRIAGISGAGQQHGSVYLNKPIGELGGWSVEQRLVDQVRPLLSRKTAPIWMDASTSEECAQIAEAAGGDAVVTRLSGSRAIERFTGPQIRRFFRQDPRSYEATREIHLVSSFVASLLTGQSAPVDLGDGAGMNLLELASGHWNEALLGATAPGLAGKLPPPRPSSTVVGPIADYFVKKYGVRAGTPVVAFTGDNPSSLCGMGATAPGTVVVSLGTSDTVFAAMSQPRTDPRGYGHVFGNPAGGFMSLICFTNGSLAREEVAKKFSLGWDEFASAILERTHPGNGGSFLLPYFVPETTPRLLAPCVRLFGSDAFVAWKDADAAARGIVESQAISMRCHSDWIGESPSRLLVTGGASRNPGILRVLSDVFQAELRTLSVGNSSALGGALRAAQALESLPWPSLFESFAAPDPGLAITPSADVKSLYDDLAAAYRARLSEVASP
jgi:xylulokinase